VIRSLYQTEILKVPVGRIKQSKSLTVISLAAISHFFIIWQCCLQETTRRKANTSNTPKQITCVLESKQDNTESNSKRGTDSGRKQHLFSSASIKAEEIRN